VIMYITKSCKICILHPPHDPLHRMNLDLITLIPVVGVEGVVRGLEGIHLADRCILTKLE
jgi:hypothetical protein